MYRKAAIALSFSLIAIPALAAGGDMKVDMFLAKADALKAKGIMALGSPDIGLLRSEGQAAGQAYRQRLQAERAAGKPSSCPPKGGKVGTDQLMAHLRTYPVAVRSSTTMKTAMAEFFIKTYPCG
jgi:hypothetical protein